MVKSFLNLKPTIGLEIHVELSTKSKMFCGCSAYHFLKKPNTNVCPVCLGLPGALPIPNIKAVEYTLALGLSLNCKLNKESFFDRKHYFYPDLPKGYQITQYDKPLAFDGFLEIDSENIVKKIRIRRIHLEEDTAKLQHKTLNGKKISLIDFNRSGVPLIEIVTEPDLSSGEEASVFSKKLKRIIRFLNISSCDMEKGTMRLEANVSWGTHLGYKVEIKNLNSFKFVREAISYELKRQKKLLEKKITPIQETRGWNSSKRITQPQRYKEEEADYRYFPEPDIPPFSLSDDFISKIKSSIPELPEVKKERLIKNFKIRKEFAEIIVKSTELASFSETVFSLAIKRGLDANLFASMIVNKKINFENLSPERFVESVLSSKRKLVKEIEVIDKWVDQAIKNLPKAVRDFQSGKINALGALIGETIKISNGKADPKVVKEVLQTKLVKLN